MAINFSSGPYFDDFDPEKNFYRVLFKPGVAVQARELNQLQSILQNQVTSVGKHLFKKNSMVIPGGIALVNFADIVSVTNINDPSVLVGKTITNATTFDITDDTTLDGYITAVVLGYKESTPTSPAALYIKYYKTQSDGRKKFNLSEQLKTVDTSLITFNVDSTIGSSIGKVVTIANGTFFTKDIFVDCNQQTIIVETDNTKVTNCVIGLNIVESIVTSDDDESLLDNANGFPNEYAPGADRYKIDLVLTRIDKTTKIDDEKFIKMMVIDNNVVSYINNKTEYAELMKTLARRTYDANGNFIVSGFDTSITEANDDNYIYANITAGKCYLGGYEYETIIPTSIAISKPRDQEYQEQVNPVTKYYQMMPHFFVAGGNYLKEIPTSGSLIQFTNYYSFTTATFDASSGSVISTANDTITITGHSFSTGNLVNYTAGGTGASAIGGLTSGSTYYIIKVDADTVKLATTSANATAGTAINLTSVGAGTSHKLARNNSSIIGYGIFRDVEYIIGTPGSDDLYRFYFDNITLEKGYTIEDVGGFLSPVKNEGGAILRELRLNNVIGNFANNNTIVPATGSGTETGLIYYYNSGAGFAYVIRNTAEKVPTVNTVKNSGGTATANIRTTFLTNYDPTFIPMIEVDSDTIKTLYTSDGITTANRTSYTVITRNDLTITTAADYSPASLLGANDTYDTPSATSFYAFITTPGAEQFVDISTSVTLTDAGKGYALTVGSGSPMLGKTVSIFSSVNKTNATEAKKTQVTVNNVIIPTPSKSWMSLKHQDVVDLLKIVEGVTINVTDASWSTNVATITAEYKKTEGQESHVININDYVVLKNIKSSNNTTGAYNSGYNGIFKVKTKSETDSTTDGVTTVTVTLTFDNTTDGGTFSSSDGFIALKPDITKDVNVTERYLIDKGLSVNQTTVSLIKLVKGAIEPKGQLGIQYIYNEISGSNYFSVDSYGDYTSNDLSYIRNIPDVLDLDGKPINTRRFLDFRFRPSSYFFKNIGLIASGSTTLVLRDLNLSGQIDASCVSLLVGKYVVGPGFLSGTTISAVNYNETTGNTELTLGVAASASHSGIYYIGLNGSTLSILDSSAGAKSFAYPRDSSKFTYQYVKFKPKQVMIYVNRDKDVLSLDYKVVSKLDEVAALRRNEYKLPLAYLYLDPYTVEFSDVSAVKFNNPVYQMLDIHDLRLRIERNEYYTLLSLTRDVNQEIINASKQNLNVSSLGFWTDNFYDVFKQDYVDPDFSATIHDKLYVSPGVYTKTIDLELDSSLYTTTWKKTDKTLTLPYTESIAFSNKNASRINNLNPFNVTQWNGKMTLYPSVDNWVDLTPPIVKTAINTTSSPITPNLSSVNYGGGSVVANSGGGGGSITTAVVPETFFHPIDIIPTTSSKPSVSQPTTSSVYKPPTTSVYKPTVTTVNPPVSSPAPTSPGGKITSVTNVYRDPKTADLSWNWTTSTGYSGSTKTDVIQMGQWSITTDFAKSLVGSNYNDVKPFLNLKTDTKYASDNISYTNTFVGPINESPSSKPPATVTTTKSTTVSTPVVATKNPATTSTTTASKPASSALSSSTSWSTTYANLFPYSNKSK